MKDIKNHRIKTLKKVIRDARKNPDVAAYIDQSEVAKENAKEGQRASKETVGARVRSR